MNNAVFEKPRKIFESIGTLKLKQQKKKTYLVSEPNYHTAKFHKKSDDYRNKKNTNINE